MKKEIGIEKLIRYLLESKGEEYKEEYYEWYRDVELEQNIDSLSELKSFIKWLVENDKIRDLDKLEYVYGIEMVRHGTEELYTAYSLYENLLMLLSISSSPIEYLISYLN